MMAGNVCKLTRRPPNIIIGMITKAVQIAAYSIFEKMELTK